MDIFIVIITLVIVIGITYILSRPFTKLEPAKETPGNTKNYRRRYEDLLREIKTLQDECKHFDAPEEICKKIEEKKQHAANLLRLINAPREENTNCNTVDEPFDPEETQPESPFIDKKAFLCPKCGYPVATSDKFCSHCGNRLHP
jgi:rubrerythrin